MSMKKTAQRLFHSDKPIMYTLSPYALIIPSGDGCGVRVERTDSGKFVLITANAPAVIHALISGLQSGVSVEKLPELLRNMGVEAPDEWIELCSREGILE